MIVLFVVADKLSQEAFNGDAHQTGSAKAGHITEDMSRIQSLFIDFDVEKLDELLESIAVVGTREQIPGLLVERYGGHVDRLSLIAPFAPDEGLWSDIVAAVKAA